MNNGLLPIHPTTVELDRVIVWRLPKELSQSKLGGRERPSNACTLIVLKLAELLHRTNTRAPLPPTVTSAELCQVTGEKLWTIVEIKENPADSQHLARCLLEAIILGNELHEKAMEWRASTENGSKKDFENFTIPDAIQACGEVFREVDFCSVNARFCQTLPRYLRTCLRHPLLRHQPRLFFIMIAFERSVLFVYERATDSLAVFDSHLHYDSDDSGGLIAVCPAGQLRVFTRWIADNVFNESQSRSNYEFELSLIHFDGSPSPSDCFPPSPVLPHQLELFSSVQLRTSPRFSAKRPSSPIGDTSPVPVKQAPLPLCDIPL